MDDGDECESRGLRLKWRRKSLDVQLQREVHDLTGDGNHVSEVIDHVESAGQPLPPVRDEAELDQQDNSCDPGLQELWDIGPDPGADDLSSQYLPSPVEPEEQLHDRFDVGGLSSFQDDNAAVLHVHMSGLSRTGVVLPWETPLMTQIFGDPLPNQSLSMPLNWGHIPEPFAATIDGPEIPSATKWTCSKYVKHVSDETYLQVRDRTMKGALAKWKFLVMLDLECSSVGRQLLDADADTVNDVLISVMGVKSPNTVLKRANAMMLFYRWQSVHVTSEFLPLKETDVWQYVISQSKTASSASRSQSLLQALRFSHYVMGFDNALQCADSRRVVGQAHIQLAGKAPSRQARPLTVAEVRVLHSVADSLEHSATDRCVASNLLLALYGRCRVSDVGYVHEILHDLAGGTGFLEVTTRFHKAARSAQQKALLLPIVLSSEGVVEQPWIQSWIRNRKECGLKTSGLIQGALMPAPVFGDKPEWLSRPLSTGEVTSILKGFLKTDDASLTSHSLKATTLSWAAKAEMPREQRRILGRHAATVQGSDSFYSRDMSVGPVNSLKKIILLIKQGKFTPDAARSNYFPHPEFPQPGTPAHVVMQPFTPAFLQTSQPMTPNVGAFPVDEKFAGAEDHKEFEQAGLTDVKSEAGWSFVQAGKNPGVIELSSDSSEDSSESGTCSESSDDDVGMEAQEEPVPAVGEAPDMPRVSVAVLAKNTKTKIIHECKDRVSAPPQDQAAFQEVFNNAVTMCGRMINRQFALTQGPFDWTAKCRVCFKGRRAP